MFQKVKENQKSLIQGAVKLKCREKKSGKIVIFGQGKPGKVREIHYPELQTTNNRLCFFGGNKTTLSISLLLWNGLRERKIT